MPKLTLDGLEKALRVLHPEEKERGPAFSVTYNSQLPKQPNTPDDKFDLFMLIPFNRWEQEHDTSKNVIADSFKEVLNVGLAGNDKTTVLIDIALLDEPTPDFMHEKRLIHHLADKLKEDDVKDKKVIIRFLVGCHVQDQLRDNFQTRAHGDKRLDVFERLFWQGGKNIINHLDATLLLGYYNPTLRISPNRPKDGSIMAVLEQILAPFENYDIKNLPDASKSTDKVKVPEAVRAPRAPLVDQPWWKRFIFKMISAAETLSDTVSNWTGKVSEYAASFAAFAHTFAKNFKIFEAYARSNGLPSVSWNHAKYLSVNGKAMMTGGFNYWGDYFRWKELPHADTNGNPEDPGFLVDFGIKMQGDVAISVHSFADEIWRNLAAMDPKFDARSMRWKANLNLPAPKFESAESADITPSIGLFDKKPLAKSGAIKVLTTARVGQMKLDDYVYPSQLLDALRDILLNTAWHYNKAFPSKVVQGNSIYDIVSTLNRFWDLPASNPLSIPGLVGTHPATWASKYARLYAIENATESIHMTAQSLVEAFGNASWKKGPTDELDGVVDMINNTMKFPPGQEWNGVLWPYDLLVAMSKALSKFAQLPASSSDATTGAIFIVLSSRDPNYGDHTSKTELRSRLTDVMKYMATQPKALPVTTRVEDVEGIVRDRLRLKRVRNGDVHQLMHAKTLCVDRSLLYIGSDNPYPAYNEEFGCWVEEPGYVESWFKGFYDGAWKGGTEGVE